MSASSKRPYPDDDQSDSSGPRRPIAPGRVNEIRESSFGSAAWTNQGNISNSTLFIQTQQAPSRSLTPLNQAFQPDTAEHRAAERRERLLQSLEFPQIDARKAEIRPPQRKTCQWLTTHPKYRDWLDPSNRKRHHGFLWMRGKAGAGKSTMMKHIYLKAERSERAGSLTAYFFFHARGALVQKSSTGMYRSLLVQLFKKFPDLQMVLDDTEYIPQNHQDCPDLEGLKHLFKLAILGLGQRTLTCFIDALDECNEEEVRDMVRFFEELAEEADEENVQFSICFSSRPYPTITVRHGMLLTLEDEEGHAQDLEKYVDTNLRIDEPSLLEEMRSRIMEKAGRIFLWVVLVVDILNKEEDAGGLALRKKLSDIPPKLSELFKNIVLRDDQSPDRLKLCVLWILCAERPLTLAEFRHALWVSLLVHKPGQQEAPVDVEVPDAANQKACEKLIINSSKGLAEITNTAQPTVQFIHESVRDFLVKDKGLQELWPELGHEWEAQSHETLKISCHSYLRISRFEDTIAGGEGSLHQWRGNLMERDSFLRKYPFLEYCSRYMLHHANHAATTIPQNDFVLNFFRNGLSRTVLNFFESRKVARYGRLTTRLYILADRGLAHLVRSEMETYPEEASVKSTGEQFGFPLFAAIGHGHRDTVAALLGLSSAEYEESGILKGFRYKKDMSGCKSYNPLSWAAAQGNLQVTKALLHQGAPNHRLDKAGYTALHRASMAGHGPVVEQLIKFYANIESITLETRATPIVLAASSGHLRVLQILLTSGANPNESDRYGKTALAHAVENGNEEIFRLLLDDPSLDVDASDREGVTALHLAAAKGHVSIVDSLLARGAHTHSSNKENETPLMCASRHGHEGVVQSLLLNGAEVNDNDEHGRTSLYHAVKNGHKAVVHILLDNKANPNISDPFGGDVNILAVAARIGDEVCARLLIQHGARIHKGDDWALVVASQHGHEAIVRLLLANGGKVFSSESRAFTYAAENGHSAVARLLLANAADVDGRPKPHDSSLSLLESKARKK